MNDLERSHTWYVEYLGREIPEAWKTGGDESLDCVVGLGRNRWKIEIL